MGRMNERKKIILSGIYPELNTLPRGQLLKYQSDFIYNLVLLESTWYQIKLWSGKKALKKTARRFLPMVLARQDSIGEDSSR